MATKEKKCSSKHQYEQQHEQHQRTKKDNCTNFGTTEFRSILRIRPLSNSKKEREDVIVLEPVCDNPTMVTLHPSPVLLALASPKPPSSSSSNTCGTPQSIQSTPTVNAIQQQHDADFTFDRVLGFDSNQDKTYLTIGLPLAKDAIETLKLDVERNANNKNGQLGRNSHIIITMGESRSGKTYTCIGNPSNLSTTRKNDSDGLVPRMLESLFSQSKHNIATGKKKLQFAVNVSIIKIHQSKINPNDCELYDVLQENTSKKSGGVTFSSILNSMDLSLNVTGSGNNSNKPRNSNIIEIQQDPSSVECIISNLTVQSCTTVEMARENLKMAIERTYKNCKKHYQSHLLIQLQPILVDSNNNNHSMNDRTLRARYTGGQITVLDMASYEGTKVRTSGRGMKGDDSPNRDDAHSAIVHCLRTIQFNIEQQQRQKLKPSSNGNSITPALKKVPFLQHKVTMLLKPMIASAQRKNVTTNIILLVTMSPNSREYDKKKELLSEVQSLHHPKLGVPVNTGLCGTFATPPIAPTSIIPKNPFNQQPEHQGSSSASRPTNKKSSKTSKQAKCVSHFSSDADDEYSQGDRFPSSVSADKTCDIESKRSNSDAIMQQQGVYFSNYKGVSSPPPQSSDGVTTNDGADQRFRLEPQPLPPPIAPTYIPPHNVVPETDFMLMSGMNAADFPGVANYSCSAQPTPTSSIPCPTRSFTTATTGGEDNNAHHLPVPNVVAASAPVEDNPNENNRYHSMYLFNYMKTLNNMVNASKKKGRQVMEKISVTTTGANNSTSSSDPNNDAVILALQKRVMKLERKNKKLTQENDWLKEQNVQLLKDMMTMKLSHQRDCDSTVANSTEDGYFRGIGEVSCDNEDDNSDNESSSCNSSNRSSIYPSYDTYNASDGMTTTGEDATKKRFGDVESKQQNAKLVTQVESVTKSTGGTCTGIQSNSISTNLLTKTTPKDDGQDGEEHSPKNSLDDPFFQHMAKMCDDEDADRWGKTNKNNSNDAHNSLVLKPTGRAVDNCKTLDIESANRYADENNENDIRNEQSPKKYLDSALFDHMLQMDKEW